MCLEWIRKMICKPTVDIEPPIIKEDIDYSELLTILRAELGNDCKIYLSDRDYRTTTKEELERFLSNDDTDKYKYVSEYYDCDNFSFRLNGQLSTPGWSDLPFGIFWSDTPNGGHAINIFVDVDRNVHIIEPQSDSVYKLPDDWTPWLVVI